MELDKLDQALFRIKLPVNFINLLLSLLCEKENQVIIENEYSESFEIQQGVDQGGVLFPNLWLIFYNLFFEMIYKQFNGYIISVTFSIRINDLSKDLIIRKSIPLLDYLDNTVWLLDSKMKIEAMLSKADCFYRYNNIKVNNDK